MENSKEVNMKIFDYIEKNKPNDKIIDLCMYNLEMYQELYEKLQEFDPIVIKKYLQYLKKHDTVINQVVEKEDMFLVELYQTQNKETALDSLIKNDDKVLSSDRFIRIHDKLLNGTDSEDKKGLRANDNYFVGYIEDDNKVVQFYPIRVELISNAIDTFLNYYNNLKIDNQYEIFLYPIIYHGLIASLQLFRDGNTRYGRIIEHLNIWKYAKNSYPSNLPILYASNCYLETRPQYRNLVNNLASNKDDEAWNMWITYNLSTLRGGILNEQNQLDKVKRKLLK